MKVELFYIYRGGIQYNRAVDNFSIAISPAISLNLNARVLDGNGSFSTPYIIG